MLYRILADLVVVLHFGFVLFVVFGGLLALRWPRAAWFHLPAAVWGILIEFFGWWCPLTKWENYLLREAGRAGYDTGFVAHYIMPIIYPPGLTRGMEIAIGVIVLIINVSVYVRVFR